MSWLDRWRVGPLNAAVPTMHATFSGACMYAGFQLVLSLDRCCICSQSLQGMHHAARPYALLRFLTQVHHVQLGRLHLSTHSEG